ncbi:MAG: phosphoglycerate dehydrogenase [Planctomycetaceae bacterium]
MSLTVKCCALNSDVGPQFELLRLAGFQCLPSDRSKRFWDASQLIQELTGCCAVVAGSEPYTREVIESLPELRVIARTGVGFDAVDLQAADERGIVVATTPGCNHHAVAEQTIAMLMAIARGFPAEDLRIRRGEWQRIERPRVMGSTLGIVGLGRIGQAVATRASGLGLNLLTFDPYANVDFCQKWGVESVSLEELLGRSDYVTLHSPCTAETRHLMNATRFAMMKAGSVLINTARGGLVDEVALVEALRSGRLRGAGLDVFEVEPLPAESPLRAFENVLMAGHVAGLDIESQRDTLTMCAETIIGLHQGKWFPDRIQNLKSSPGWKW